MRHTITLRLVSLQRTHTFLLPLGAKVLTTTLVFRIAAITSMLLAMCMRTTLPMLMRMRMLFLPVPSGSHIPMFESNEAVASVCPDGAHATALTVFACPVGMFESKENLHVALRDGSEAE